MIFGCRGQLGVELVTVFKPVAIDVAGFDRAKVDITDAAQVEQVFATEDPAIVINAAAYNQVDVAEKEPLPAMQANGLAVRNLAMACRQHDARLVHFSTDYVFDGTAWTGVRRRRRSAASGCLCRVSKLAGELYAQAYLDHPLIIRTSGVFGPGGLDTARGNFIETMLRLAARHSADPRAERSRRLAHLFAVSGRPHGRPGGSRSHRQFFTSAEAKPISWFDYAAMIFRVSPACIPSSSRPTSASSAPPRAARNIRRCPTPKWNAAA